MPKFVTWFINNKKNSIYSPPEKPTTMEKIVDKMWDVMHFTIIPNMIIQDGKIDGINQKTNWQMILLGLILAAMSCIIGLCLTGHFS